MGVFNGPASAIEDNRNKVNEINEQSTENQYPSAFASYNLQQQTKNYVNDNFANALKGTKTGAEVVIGDVSPLSHNIKVTVSGAEGAGVSLAKGEFIGAVAEITDESIMEHEWYNEDELGSFSVYPKVVPIDNRTNLYVNIPSFPGASAGLLVTNGTVYRTFYACSYEGGEVYCYIDGTTINISYDGQTVISYGIEENSKIIGVGCNGEGFFDESLDLYACEMGSGVKLYRSGKNLLPYPFNGSNNGQYVNYTFTDNGDGSITVKGQHNNSIGHANFYLLSNGKLVLPKGSYTASGLVAGIYLQGVRTADGVTVNFTNGLTLTETTEFKTLFMQILKTNTTAYDTVIKPMLEMGTTATEYEAPVETTECVVNADGTANVLSLYPTTRLYTDTEGVTITAEYNRDINKAFAELTNALISFGGNV